MGWLLLLAIKLLSLVLILPSLLKLVCRRFKRSKFYHHVELYCYNLWLYKHITPCGLMLLHWNYLNEKSLWRCQHFPTVTNRQKESQPCEIFIHDRVSLLCTPQTLYYETFVSINETRFDLLRHAPPRFKDSRKAFLEKSYRSDKA